MVKFLLWLLLLAVCRPLASLSAFVTLPARLVGWQPDGASILRA